METNVCIYCGKKKENIVTLVGEMKNDKFMINLNYEPCDSCVDGKEDRIFVVEVVPNAMGAANEITGRYAIDKKNRLPGKFDYHITFMSKSFFNQKYADSRIKRIKFELEKKFND